MFMSDVICNDKGKLKTIFNIVLGHKIYIDLQNLTQVIRHNKINMYKYSILILRNSNRFTIKLIDIEVNDGIQDTIKHDCALDTMLEFWRRTLYKRIPSLRLPDHKA